MLNVIVLHLVVLRGTGKKAYIKIGLQYGIKELKVSIFLWLQNLKKVARGLLENILKVLKRKLVKLIKVNVRVPIATTGKVIKYLIVRCISGLEDIKEIPLLVLIVVYLITTLKK